MSVSRTLSELGDAPYDLIVLGAGAAGFSAAITARLAGQRVLLVERTRYVGGTSAFSGGTTWVPNTHHSGALGAEDDFAKASGFLDRAVGDRSPKGLRDAFLRAAPEAIALLETRTQVQFRGRPFHPDYLSELEGATSFGRALEPKPFDGSVLGADLYLIRPPIPEMTILGGMMIDRDDIFHLLRMKKSARSLAYSVGLVGRYGLNRLRWKRDPRLVMGNALIGRMLHAARQLGIDLLVSAETRELVIENGRVAGIVVEQGGVKRAIAATAGVVLASGGFARHKQKRAHYLPQPTPEYSPAAPGHTGALHDMALALGAHYPDSHDQPVFWAPVSVRTRKDGSTAVFPHFVMDRSKPGTLSVGRDGKRFVNESTSYHLFGKAMFEANADGSHIPVYMIADAAALRKYGLGMIRPGAGGLEGFLADGYVVSAPSVAELAAKLGIDAENLVRTVAAMNRYAADGVDPEFGRGTTIYHRANGDAAHGPNPTLGALEEAPFYAIRLYPGDIGASIGLVTDADARVLRADGAAIAGLYACGNDMASIMGGVYPAPGITIGPAVTFGYLAARHAAAPASGKENAHAA